MYTFELWYSSLKTIEGNFGSSVASYFKFVRWLFLMNLLVMVFTFGFIVIPQILYDIFGETTTATGSDFDFTDIATGDGYFTDTLLYYGHYTNRTLDIMNGGGSYNIPFAYFFTMVTLFFFCFIVLSFRLVKQQMNEKNFYCTVLVFIQYGVILSSQFHRNRRRFEECVCAQGILRMGLRYSHEKSGRFEILFSLFRTEGEHVTREILMLFCSIVLFYLTGIVERYGCKLYKKVVSIDFLVEKHSDYCKFIYCDRIDWHWLLSVDIFGARG